jgi:ribosomal protein S27E
LKPPAPAAFPAIFNRRTVLTEAKNPMSDQVAVCPECSKRIRVKPGTSGRRIRCPGCGDHFDFVPDHEDPGLETSPAGQSKGKKVRRDGTAAKGISRLLQMPMSLFGALILVVAMIVLRVVDGMLDREIPRELVIFRLVIGVTVFLALLSTFRLGWLWTRFVSVLALIYLGYGLFSFVLAGALDVEFFIGFVIPIAMHLGILAALDRPSTRDFFRLKCPDCKSLNAGAADFLFRRAKCRDCDRRW